jgi:two-component system sensor kinase FixL
MDGDVISWNQGAERLTGYRAEEMLGQPIARLYPPEQRSFLEHQVITPLKEKGQHAVEVLMRKKSGEDIYAHLSLSLLRDDKGVTIGMIGYSMDITERKQMEEALRIGEERFRVALKHSAITVFNQDRDLRYSWIHNPPKELTNQQIVGKRDSDLLEQSEDTRRIENIKRRVLHTGIGSRQEICIRLGGIDRFYELTVEPLRAEPNGQIKGVTGAAFDITQRKLMEDEARQHQAELAHMARLSAAGEMASGMTHELSQPLMAIELSAGSCLNRLKSGQCSEEVINRVQAIADQGHRALEIIQRMKNFTRKTKLQRTGVDINALLQEVASWTRSEVRNKNVAVQFILADSVPPAYVDAIQIQQVVLNLVRNAIDAMQDTETGQRELCFKTAPTENDTIEVTISDTGSGLAPENIDRLFKPFFTTKSSGMGLGLSISKTIVETHGGRLWATPHSNHGTAFHFTLPILIEDSSVNELRKKIS